MKSLRVFMSLTMLVMAACSTGEPKGVTPAPTAVADVTEADGHVAQCHPACSVPSDCAVPGSAMDDASHFACTAGTCVWQGCRSDVECNTDAPSGTPRLVCRTGPGSPVPTCVPGCSAPADCATTAGNALTDASHFACEAGACVWQGCASTAECASALHIQKVVCEEPAGAPAPMCEPTCTTAADCASPGQPLEDASHFACNAGRCAWLGCRSTADCTSALHTSHLVCE
jgi:hypothetical protein